MAIAGRVAIVPKGDWSADATYKRLDAVTYNNTLYFAKKDVPAGTVTGNTEYWSRSIVGGGAGGVATADEAGVVKPADGLTIAEDGTLKVNIDGTTLTMDQVNNVIKLADTLKDAINGAFPAANVANNQITTVEGFALDARQANPNIDGSLAKQISDLNGSLKSKILNEAFVSYYGAFDLGLGTDYIVEAIMIPGNEYFATPFNVSSHWYAIAYQNVPKYPIVTDVTIPAGTKVYYRSIN